MSETKSHPNFATKLQLFSRCQQEDPEQYKEPAHAMAKFVLYGSKIAHTSVERAGLIAGIKVRLLDFDNDFSMRGETLESAIKEDKANGYAMIKLAKKLVREKYGVSEKKATGKRKRKSTTPQKEGKWRPWRN